MLTMNINIVGSDAVANAFKALGDAGVDPRPPFRQFGLHMKTIAGRSIRAQADPSTGTPWPKVSGLALASRPGGGKDGKALANTGALLRSFKEMAVSKEGVSVSSSLPYANLMQYGGIVRPKNAKSLAIPMNREAARAGSARRWWAQAEAQGRKPFVLARRGGSFKVIMAYEKPGGGKSKKLAPYFLLMQKTTIKARPFVGFAAEDTALLASLMLSHLGKAIEARKAGGGAQ